MSGPAMPKIRSAIRIQQRNAPVIQDTPTGYLPLFLFGSALLCLCVMFATVIVALKNWPSREELEAEGDSPADQAGDEGGPGGSGMGGPAAATRKESKESARRSGTKRKPRMPPTLRCDRTSFTYCAGGPNSTTERYYYDQWTRSCVSTLHKIPEVVCNRGRNRFATLQQCRRHCVTKRPPSRQCSTATFFATCSERDLKHSWWFWDGDYCVKWNFPEGRCLEPVGQELTTESACLKTCMPKGNVTDNPLNPTACWPSKSVPCAAKLMRYPFFARRKGSGFECIEVNAQALQHNVCSGDLSASNFDTAAACRAACKSGKKTN